MLAEAPEPICDSRHHEGRRGDDFLPRVVAHGGLASTPRCLPLGRRWAQALRELAAQKKGAVR